MPVLTTDKAIVLQRMWRRRAQRRKGRRFLKVLERARHRTHNKRRKRAALRIQMMWRMKAARLAVRRLQLAPFAVTMQALARGFLQRRATARMRPFYLAARVIQVLWCRTRAAERRARSLTRGVCVLLRSVCLAQIHVAAGVCCRC